MPILLRRRLINRRKNTKDLQIGAEKPTVNSYLHPGAAIKVLRYNKVRWSTQTAGLSLIIDLSTRTAVKEIHLKLI